MPENGGHGPIFATGPLTAMSDVDAQWGTIEDRCPIGVAGRMRDRLFLRRVVCRPAFRSRSIVLTGHGTASAPAPDDVKP
jgi:hypothetical protein